MENLKELLGSFTSRLAEGIGLKPTDQQELKAWAQKFETHLKENEDRLEDLKEEIRKIEARIMQLKVKLDQAHGMVKRIIGKQIEQALNDLDRKEKRSTIIFRNIDTVSLALDKIREVLEAIAGGVLDEDKIDELTERMKEGLDVLDRSDEARKELEETEYKATEEPEVDIEKRTKELAGQKDSAPYLSEAAAARLKQLEKEMEG
jgi:chromosome segregation ATPase